MALPTKKPRPWASSGQRPRLLGRYHVLDEMGRNAVGPLYLARLEGPKGFQRWAAIRKIDKRHLAEEGYVQRFYERVKEGAKLLHPNVAALFDIGEEDGTPWVAMEYLHGERVEQMIERLELAETPASWEIAARVIADAADGLHAVHNLRDKDGAPLGLLHGDLAPHSLFVTYEGKTKIKGAFEPRAHGVLDPRKVPYAAPEQLFDGAVDARADVFALGVLLWELLAGRRLFARRSEDETRAMIEAGVVPPLVGLIEELPGELDELVRRALMRSPMDRFASARELSRELESLLVAQGVVARDDDVGRYMRTLFADRYTEHESRLSAAADTTEVFRRSQQAPSARALAAIPDLSARDEEEDVEQTELMKSPLQPSQRVSGYTDEILADSGPTMPRQQRLEETDEIPTITAPQTPLGPSVPSSRRRTSGEELTLTGSANPLTSQAPLRSEPLRGVAPLRSEPLRVASQAKAPEKGRLIMPAALESEPDITESAIFVAPRSRAPTPPEHPDEGPPRPVMPSFPDRPLLPSTPTGGVMAQPRPPTRSSVDGSAAGGTSQARTSVWPPPPLAQAPFVPPPAFRAFPPAASRGEHAAMSTMSLRAVLFPRDRARRIAVVSVVGSIGGAILFLMFFAMWRVMGKSPSVAAPVSAMPVTTAPVAQPLRTTQPATSATPIPILDLQQPTSQPTSSQQTTSSQPTSSRHHGARAPSTSTVTAPPTGGGKSGYLTVWCKPNACDHVIDGARDLGGSPIFKQEVSSGKHILTLRIDSTHSQKVVSVDVPEGENATIHSDTSQ